MSERGGRGGYRGRNYRGYRGGRGRGGEYDGRGRDERRDRGGVSQREEERADREGSATRGREKREGVTDGGDRGPASNGAGGKDSDNAPRPQRQSTQPRKKEGGGGERVGVGES